MDIRRGFYAMVLSSVMIISSSGCETVSYLDDTISNYVDKHEDWTKDTTRNHDNFSVFKLKKDKNPEQKY
ncbi:hypothetical protein J4205_02810 [Candidatus Pacearchaeota archaeon]|nr:hypothetical protein [Candidatus Pacearchaeota archaeon]